MAHLAAVVVLLTLLASASLACAEGWKSPLGHPQVDLWPHGAPGSKVGAGPEVDRSKPDGRIAGRPIVLVSNVSHPTMTVFPAMGKTSGIAVVVFPGGGYKVLAMDLEGTEVCERLSALGITAVLLKYRVPSGAWPKSSMPIQDAQRAIRLVRARAAEWHVDPRRVGVLGFSAGGHLVVACSTMWKQRTYPPVDAADRLSCRPDFAVPIYPGHLATQWVNGGEVRSDRLNARIRVASDTPPTFLLQAVDDPVDPVQNSLVYAMALRDARVPVEMHLYATGGHAFGVRHVEGHPITDWPSLVVTWLGTLFRARQ